MATKIEAQLKEYRALRRRKYLIDNAEDTIESKEKETNSLVPKFGMHQGNQQDEVVLLKSDEASSTSTLLIQPEDNDEVASETSELAEASQESWTYFTIKWSIYFIIWLTVYIIFLKLQFGAVYFVFSVLIGIYLNTRTRPKKEGEISAYSVFNENCVSIDGTLKAEQIERELMFGPGSVR